MTKNQEGSQRPKPMRATCNGVTIAESHATIVVEGNHYLPAESVDWELWGSVRVHG